MSNYKIKLLDTTTVLIIIIGVFNTGTSTPIILGFRFIDLLIIILSFIVFFKTKKIYKSIIPFILFFFVASFSGIINQTENFISDTRYFIIVILAIFSGVYFGKYFDFKNSYKVFVILITAYIFTYLLLYLLPFLQMFYSPNSLNIYDDEYRMLKIIGPSTVILTYLYIPLIFSKLDYKRATLLYLAFILFFYFTVNSSRQILAISIAVIILGALKYFNIKLLTLRFIIVLLLLIFTMIVFIQFADERTSKIFDPFSDSSFMYRIMSIKELWNKISSKTFTLLLGLGSGSTLFINLGKYIGIVKINIIDNTILTILMKSGVFGLLFFIYGLIKPLTNNILKFDTILIIIAPLVIASLISAHLLYNIEYVFGYFYSINIIKRLKHNEDYIYND